MRKVAMALVGIALALGLMSCSTADKIENKITCSDVCNRYRDCFNANYDTAACSDKCEAEANTNQDKDRRLELCNTCIDDQSCTSAVYDCATDCAGIIVI
jgi:hypothetical protein